MSEEEVKEENTEDSIETIEFDEKQHAKIQSYCFLKTKTEKLKCYWASIIGKEIFFYKDNEAQEYKLMHSLIGTYAKEMPLEPNPVA